MDNTNLYTVLQKLEETPQRMWINQPSTLQDHHKYHGKNVLTIPPVIYGKNGKYIRVYFTEGTIISMNMSINSLSSGWK